LPAATFASHASPSALPDAPVICPTVVVTLMGTPSFVAMPMVVETGLATRCRLLPYDCLIGPPPVGLKDGHHAALYAA
jgi:hypothetical protein